MKSKKNIKNMLIASIAAVFMLTGCNNIGYINMSQNAKDVMNQDVQQKAIYNVKDEQSQISKGTVSAPVKISYKTYTQSIKDEIDESLLLEYKIIRPEISNPDNDDNIMAINKYYKKQTDDFINSIITEELEIAKSDRESARVNGYTYRPYSYGINIEICYNGNNLLSVLSKEYRYTGGAHPMSIWHSATFDLKTGKKLSLSDIFGVSKEEALEKVYETVLSKIEKAKGTEEFFYFENYKEDIYKYYSEDDFILTGDGITFYYQLYAIAPYAAGFPIFNLPLSQAGPLAIDIPPLPSKKIEN
ncbi:hypothetical protein OXPF_08660 [Oxobacter pfennigii]|uniref:Peptidoglycan-N-acetylmuramic acid deacetylase PdaC n=1 Tax=Oxobacter pfennigii TaxID=36849 RepID=A0A0P8Z0F1_9CLOT|nr:DUF3298 and DUF4163 domain-containing protein [Oxobacter pfennigii]KPU45633.1 hypothetical protein OXPF_08660 [Oxobacter pfennigii]